MALSVPRTHQYLTLPWIMKANLPPGDGKWRKILCVRMLHTPNELLYPAIASRSSLGSQPLNGLIVRRGTNTTRHPFQVISLERIAQSKMSSGFIGRTISCNRTTIYCHPHPRLDHHLRLPKHPTEGVSSVTSNLR